MNNKKWQTLTVLILTSGLMACSTTSQQSVTAEQTTDLKSKAKIESMPATVDEVQPNASSQPLVKVDKKVDKQPSKLSSDSLNQRQFGYEEWVYIPGLRQSFKAHLDVNVPFSSIYAQNIKVFERNGKDWVRFQVANGVKSSKGVALPVKRWVSSTRLLDKQTKMSAAHPLAVVETWIQLGDLKDKTDFILIDNAQSKLPLTLGQSFLQGVASVALDKKYLELPYHLKK